MNIKKLDYKSLLFRSAIVLGILLLAGELILLRFDYVTEHLYAGLVKDPPRYPPDGRVIVAPADGTVLYIKKAVNGVIPEIVKEGVPVQVNEHIKSSVESPSFNGILVGIYMHSQGVHINRIPLTGKIESISVYNGPYLSMNSVEAKIVLTQLLPGWISLKKLIGLPPFDISDRADYILKSARDSTLIRDVRGLRIYITRIADYYVGRLLTWVREGQSVTTGQKFGYISWGSQTDILIESSPGLSVLIKPGDHVKGGETVIAEY